MVLNCNAKDAMLRGAVRPSDDHRLPPEGVFFKRSIMATRNILMASACQ